MRAADPEDAADPVAARRRGGRLAPLAGAPKIVDVLAGEDQVTADRTGHVAPRQFARDRRGTCLVEEAHPVVHPPLPHQREPGERDRRHLEVGVGGLRAAAPGGERSLLSLRRIVEPVERDLTLPEGEPATLAAVALLLEQPLRGRAIHSPPPRRRARSGCHGQAGWRAEPHHGRRRPGDRAGRRAPEPRSNAGSPRASAARAPAPRAQPESPPRPARRRMPLSPRSSDRRAGPLPRRPPRVSSQYGLA